VPKRLIAIIAVLLAGCGTAVADPSAAIPSVSLRLEVFKAVNDVIPDWAQPQMTNSFGWRWEPLKCDGTDVLDGIGQVRVIGYATNYGSTRTSRLRITYTPGERWYQYIFPKLPLSGETKVYDSIQDLDGTVPTAGFRFLNIGAGSTECNFAIINAPAFSAGFISHRSTPDVLIEGLSIEVRNYADDAPIPCGSTGIKTARVKVFLHGTSSTPTIANLHMHVETGPPLGTGPDQSGSPNDRRWWEAAMDFTPVPNVDAQVLPGVLGWFTSTIRDSRATFHFAQQTAPGQPKNEVFCSFTP
jgi:hypothetical protein